MKRVVVILIALAMPVMFSWSMGGGAGADPAGDYVYTCGADPFPEPIVADLCLPESAPSSDWHIGSTGNPVMDCGVTPDDPARIPGLDTVVADSSVQCPQPAYNLSISVHIIWTTCQRHDGTQCDTHSNSNPHNPDGPNGCNYCKFRSATATMYGPHPYTRYYWAHTVVRRTGASVFSHWSDPIPIYLP